MEMPERLKRRPLFKGFPVPANVMVDPVTGIPDFATIEEEQSTRLIKERRCALCGDALYRWFAIIGGPASGELHLFRDGPMHEECARYAMTACPFLSKAEHTFRPSVKEHEGYATHEVSLVSEKKPEVQGLFVARQYQLGRYRGEMVVKVGPYREVSWWRSGRVLTHSTLPPEVA